MSQSRADEADQPVWAVRAAQPGPHCYICGRGRATATTVLAGHLPNGGTKVPCCVEGRGCRDGRVYHGPQGAPHWPGEACPICARSTGMAQPARARRRNTRRS